MRRGESVSEGCVKFPFDSTAYAERAGMGLYVKLVVLNQVEGMCVGAYVVDMLNEVLVGDDKRPHPKDKPLPTEDPHAILAAMEEEQNAHNAWVGFHYPRHADENKSVESYLSLAIIERLSSWAQPDGPATHSRRGTGTQRLTT